MEILLKTNGDNIDYSAWILAALKNYDLRVEKVELIRHNENITSEIFSEEGHFILRIRKPCEGFSIGILDSDLSTAELLASEIDLLQYVSKHSAIPFQEPIQTKKEAFEVFGIEAICSFTDEKTIRHRDMKLHIFRHRRMRFFRLKNSGGRYLKSFTLESNRSC